MKPTEWMAYATASNATATATKAAKTTGRHTISSVHASYDDSTVSGTLTVTVTIDGVSTAVIHYVHGSDVLPFEVRGDVGTAVSAALAAGGTGVDGYVTVVGHTEG